MLPPVILSWLVIAVGVFILSRNHYKGRPADGAKKGQNLDRARYLEEQNEFLSKQNEMLLGMIASLKAVLENKVSLASPTGRDSLPESSVGSDDIFINPMSDESSIQPSFTELGDRVEEKADAEALVDKLRRLRSGQK